ncbi:hypothetical protein ABPG77_008203 [Micractinium sp. CCAP 211/92]
MRRTWTLCTATPPTTPRGPRCTAAGWCCMERGTSSPTTRASRLPPIRVPPRLPQNCEVEATYPHQAHRDDVGALWYADVDRRDGTLHSLTVTPTRLRKLSLTQPEPEDVQYLLSTLDRECRKLGGSHGVRLAPGGRWLELALQLGPPGGAEE